MTQLTERFDRALLYAADLHRSQRRKATEIPYITHLLTVASLVLEDGGSEDEAIAALLHDGPEDQGGEAVLTEIRARFGEAIADLVADLSDSMVATGDAKPPWRERKLAYLERLGAASASVLKVSIADKLHNARTILTDLRAEGPTLWDRFNAGPDEQAWYFWALLDLFERRLPNSRNVPELRRVVADLFT
jgi:(p)ppGpp synthase/HD superfamily hydrolase